MTNFDSVYSRLLTADLSVMTNEVIADMNNAALSILSTPVEQRNNILFHDLEMIVLISNILYNNTDSNLLPLEDETYDKLQIIYKEAFPNTYKIGAPEVDFRADKTNTKPYKDSAPIRLIRRPEINKSEMIFGDVFNQEIFTRLRNPEVIDADATEQRRRNVMHNHPMLAGTLDKCTWVMVEDAARVDPKLLKDPTIKIFERDFMFKNRVLMPTITKMIFMLKYDGVAIEADCTDEVVSARTRGDTSANQTTDVSAIFRGYKFPKTKGLDTSNPIGIQFEAIIDCFALNKINKILNKNYINARTAIIGIIGRNDAPKFRDFITLVPVEAEIPGDKETRLQFLNQYYANSIPCYYATVEGTPEQILYACSRFHYEANKMRSYLPFMYDGIVAEICDPYTVERLGRKNSVNQYQIAIKFQPLAKLTRFLGYTFTVGQTGVITPMLHYMPATLLGATHVKSSGHSYKRFMELGLKPGDIVEVAYRHDVTPYATKPMIPENMYNQNPPIPFPTICPECGAPIIVTGDHAYCTNVQCPGRVLARVTSMLEKLGIKDISEERVKKLQLWSLSDFMNVDSDRIYAALGEAVGNTLIDQINDLKSRPIEDYTLVGAIGFKGLAQKTWQKLFTIISIDELVALNDMELYNRLSPVKGIGPATINVIKDERGYYMAELMTILNMPNLVRTTGHVQNFDKRICMTNVRDTDGSIRNAIDVYNPNVELTDGSVTKNTDLLLVPYDGFDRSTKVKTAIKYGIPVVSVSTFLNNVKLYI